MNADKILDELNSDDESNTESGDTDSEAESQDDNNDEGGTEDKDEPSQDDETDSEGDETDDELDINEEDIEAETDKKDDEELEFTSIPKRAEILKAFPEIFKKFPGIEKAIYREQQYAEVFPTLDDAREAAQTQERYRGLENDLLSGDLKPLLKTLKQNATDSYENIADNLLETIYEVDQQSYANLLNRVVQNTLAQAFAKGKNEKNEQLEIAAEIIYNAIYQTKEVKPYEKISKKQDDGPEKKLRDERIQLARQQLDSAVKDVSTRAQNVIKSSVDKNIDPKGQMSSYIKQKAIDDVMQKLNQSFNDDKAFRSVTDNLWKKAATEHYSEAARVKVRNAFIAKAKAVLPGIINRVRTEALKGSRQVVRQKEQKKRILNSDTREKKISTPDKKQSTYDFLSS